MATTAAVFEQYRGEVDMSARSDPARIRISGAGKRYQAHQVFHNVDLTVGEREVVAIIGPSGCGKTTLLRCIDGLTPLTQGEILIEDRAMRAPREGVAMVFQHF